MTAVIPFVCRESRQRRSFWMPVVTSPTRRNFVSRRDLNIKIAVDAASCGWVGVLQWLKEMGCPIDSGEISEAAVRHGQLEVVKWLDTIRYTCSHRTVLSQLEGDTLRYYNGFSQRMSTGVRIGGWVSEPQEEAILRFFNWLNRRDPPNSMIKSLLLQQQGEGTLISLHG